MASHTEESTDDESETKTLHVRVEPTESFHERVLDRLGEIDDGRREPFEDRYGLSVTDFNALSRVFSETNLTLLQTIAAHEPESIRETARIVDRGTKEVHQNLTELAELGLIEFEEHGRAKRPTVFYDEIEVTVPLPPSEDDEAETAPA